MKKGTKDRWSGGIQGKCPSSQGSDPEGIPEVPPPLLMDSALASSGPDGHRGSFWQLLTKSTPAAPCYQNLATQTQ